MPQNTDRAAVSTVGPAPEVVRAELEAQRRFRHDQLIELAAAAEEAVADSDAQRLHDTRLLTSSAEAAMAEITAAFGRLDSGTYGVCENCAGPILSERLEVVPLTRLCTACQQRSESGRNGGRP